MKKFIFLLLTLVLFTSCEPDDDGKVAFKYHRLSTNLKQIGRFQRGLSVGDTTTVLIQNSAYVVILDSLIPKIKPR